MVSPFERAFQRKLGAGCQLAFAAHAVVDTLCFFHDETGLRSLPLAPDDFTAPAETATRILKTIWFRNYLLTQDAKAQGNQNCASASLRENQHPMASGIVYLLLVPARAIQARDPRRANSSRRADVLVYDYLVHPELDGVVPRQLRKNLRPVNARTCTRCRRRKLKNFWVARPSRRPARRTFQGRRSARLRRGGEEAQQSRRRRDSVRNRPWRHRRALAAGAYAGIPLTHLCNTSSALIPSSFSPAMKTRRSTSPAD